MLNYSAWSGADAEAIDSNQRAQDAWRRIQMKPHSIAVVRRKGDEPPANQTCRIEYEKRTNEREGKGMTRSAVRSCIIFGVHGHPTQSDFDIQRDDQFAWNGSRFTVMDVTILPGEIQAKAEASQ